jgi:RNA polymerase sigma-70 factor (ECF subfamily)
VFRALLEVMEDQSHSPPSAEKMDDLVVRARNNRTAFGELYDLYYTRIFRHCLRRLFQRDVAEDVTAEVFLNVARHMGSFAGQTHAEFLRWTHTIATNQINAYLRKSERRARLLEGAARRGVVEAGGQCSSQVDLALLDWPHVYQSLLKLKSRDQSIIVLRFFDAMSHSEIAAILNMQPGAVRAAERRALEKFRNDLGIES